MKITEYLTATADNIEALDKSVNGLIDEGFQPFGSPYYCATTGATVDSPVCQAMVKYAES